MFENVLKFFKGMSKKKQNENQSKDTAKERLHLVLMQDRANVSADFLELMKQEIIEVIKKYVEVDEKSIDVRLTNKSNDDCTNGAPALYSNIPIVNIRNDMKKEIVKEEKKEKDEQITEDKKDNINELTKENDIPEEEKVELDKKDIEENNEQSETKIEEDKEKQESEEIKEKNEKNNVEEIEKKVEEEKIEEGSKV